MKAVGYIRVSTSGQATEDKLSLKNQADQIRKYCFAEDFELIEPPYEDVISGAKDDRSGLQALLAAARNKEFQHVVVNDITRFGRSARDLLNNIHQLEKCGVTFHSKKQKCDSSTKFGKFMLQILAACAEMELETIQVRMGEVKLAKWKAGKVLLGSPPYGYKFNEDRSALLINESVDGILQGEAKYYTRMVDQYVMNYNMDDIVISFQKDHILSRSGGTWFASNISDILKNPIYTGYAVYNQYKKDKNGKILGKKPESEHVVVTAPPLITKALWDEIQVKIQKNKENKVGRPRRGAETFWLRDYLTCGICGKKVIPFYMTKRGYRYYTCYWHAASEKKILSTPGSAKCSLPYIKAEWVEDFVSTWFNSKFEPHHFEPVMENKHLDEQIEKTKEKIRSLSDDLAGKERAINTFRRWMENPKFDQEKGLEDRNTLLAEKRDLKEQLLKEKEELLRLLGLKEDEQRFNEFRKTKIEVLQDLYQKLINLNNEQKRKLITASLKGNIVIKPPEPYEKIEGDTFLAISPWIQIDFNYNTLIFQEIISSDAPKRNERLSASRFFRPPPLQRRRAKGR